MKRINYVRDGAVVIFENPEIIPLRFSVSIWSNARWVVTEDVFKLIQQENQDVVFVETAKNASDMPIESASTHSSSPEPPSTPRIEPTAEQRWAAWVARGAAHDRLMRRRWSIAAPIVAAVAVIAYLLFAR